MALGGLWHGAGLNFLFWGVLHGCALMLSHGLRDLRQRLGRSPEGGGPVGKVLGWLLTFAFVTFAWIFFRAESFDQGWGVVLRLVALDGAGESANLIVLGLVLLLLLKEFWNFDMQRAYAARMARIPLLVHAVVLGVLGTLLLRLGPDGVPQFIYFQF